MTAGQFEFGPFPLDASNNELRRDGTPIKLRPQAFSVLGAVVHFERAVGVVRR